MRAFGLLVLAFLAGWFFGRLWRDLAEFEQAVEAADDWEDDAPYTRAHE